MTVSHRDIVTPGRPPLRPTPDRAARPWSRRAAALLFAPLCLLPRIAVAQNTTTLITPAIDPDYNRDRNTAVTERPHPDFDPILVRLGGFLLSPSLRVSAAATDNVYTSDTDKVADVFTIVEPYARLASDWSVHQVALVAAGDIRRFAKQTLRNQNGFYVDASGRLDVTSEVNAKAEFQVARGYESPFAGDLATNVTVLSSYLRNDASVTGTRTGGRTRAVVTFDRTGFSFNQLRFANGTSRSQAERDRVIDRVGVLGEYAVSPSASFYAQVNVDKTDYTTVRLNGSPNRNSTGLSVTGGINLDLAGLLRGSVGVGLVERNYRSDLYRNVLAPSVQAKVAFFPSPLTTVTVAAQRLIQDQNLGNGGAYADTRVSLAVDHELLQNLIVSATADLARQSFYDSPDRTSLFYVNGSGQFQMTRSLGFEARVSYGSVKPAGNDLGNSFTELRGQLAVRFRI